MPSSVKHPTLAGALLLFLILNCVLVGYDWASNEGEQRDIAQSIKEVKINRAIGDGNRALMCAYLSSLAWSATSEQFDELCLADTVGASK